MAISDACEESVDGTEAIAGLAEGRSAGFV